MASALKILALALIVLAACIIGGENMALGLAVLFGLPIVLGTIYALTRFVVWAARQSPSSDQPYRRSGTSRP